MLSDQSHPHCLVINNCNKISWVWKKTFPFDVRSKKIFWSKALQKKKLVAKLFLQNYIHVYDYWTLPVLGFLYICKDILNLQNLRAKITKCFLHTLVIVKCTESFNISFCDGRWQFFHTMDANWPVFFVLNQGGKRETRSSVGYIPVLVVWSAT